MLNQFNLLSGHWTPDHTQLQRHISAIIAHTVWAYYLITDDITFLCDCGAELLIEVDRGKIYLNPSFPTQIKGLGVNVQLQANEFQIEKIGDRLNITAASTNQSSVSMIYQGEAVDLQPGKSLSFTLRDCSLS